MTRQAQIRRLQVTLTIVGGGVIAFGVWTLAKVALALVFLNDEQIHRFFELDAEMPMSVLLVSLGIVLFVDLGMRAFIGLSARAEGKGKRKGFVYLIFAVLVAITNAVSVVLGILSSATSATMLFDVAVGIVIDATSFASLVLMLFCAVRLRRLSASEG